MVVAITQENDDATHRIGPEAPLVLLAREEVRLHLDPLVALAFGLDLNLVLPGSPNNLEDTVPKTHTRDERSRRLLTTTTIIITQGHHDLVDPPELVGVAAGEQTGSVLFLDHSPRCRPIPPFDRRRVRIHCASVNELAGDCNLRPLLRIAHLRGISDQPCDLGQDVLNRQQLAGAAPKKNEGG